MYTITFTCHFFFVFLASDSYLLKLVFENKTSNSFSYLKLVYLYIKVNETYLRKMVYESSGLQKERIYGS